MGDFIFDTTGNSSIVQFEELGAYFNHPTSSYTLSDYFDLQEISNSQTIQDAIDNGDITAYDENGSIITSLDYIIGEIPVFATDNATSTLSYVGFGAESACKILQVSSTGTTYTSLWAGGNESFDKIWSARTGYSYF
jgi:hypothetical protein